MYHRVVVQSWNLWSVLEHHERGKDAMGKHYIQKAVHGKKANQLVGLLSYKREQCILKLPMHVLPFFLFVLHILVMMCVNYSCTCGCEVKYYSSPQFLSLVETSKGFNPLFLLLCCWLVPSGSRAWGEDELQWGGKVMEELKLRLCCMYLFKDGIAWVTLCNSLSEMKKCFSNFLE